MSLMSFIEFLAVVSASIVLGRASYEYGKAVGFWDGYDYVLTLLGFGPDFESKGDDE